MLKAHPGVGNILYSRIKSMKPDEVASIAHSINPQNMQALMKLLPELSGTISKAAKGGYGKPQAQQMPPAGHGAPMPPQQGQGQGSGLLSKFGFARGGSPALARNGYVNRGIPNTSFAKGGFAMPHIAAPPHAAAPQMSMPGEAKVTSRKYNTPTFEHGGLVAGYMTGGGVGSDPGGMPGANSSDGGQIPGNYACGGPAMQQAQQSMIQNPQMAQKAAMQNGALSMVPQEGKADNVPANLSKGEFVMCSPSVMWFGMAKLAKMQEQAHKGMMENQAMQQVNQQMAQGQQQGQGPQPGQMPGRPQPQQGPPQQRPQPPQGLAAPPPGMGAAVANTNGAPMPNPQQQRIQATNTPRPKGNALSAIQ